MNITLDFGTVVVTVMSIATFGCVLWGTAPTTPVAPAVGMTMGERLLTGLTAAATVIAIGSFIAHGVKRIELPKDPIPVVTNTYLPVASAAPLNTGTATGK